jgi:hypothetical protein
MYNWIVTHQALIREVINGFCMVLFLALTLMVLVFMWDTWVVTNPKRDWRTAPGMPTACALWWIFAAESYRTGAIWALYNIGKHDHRSPFPTADAAGIGVFGEAGFWSTFGYLTAGVMLIVGLQRAIYIFTPPEWKRKVWLYATISAGIFCLIPSTFNLIARFYLNGI